jgi:RNA polymerase sigma-70 factor (ECF subfamily)
MSSPRPNPGDGEPTIDILRAVRAGDVRRFGELYERIAPALFAWSSLRIRTSLRGRLDPEDVIQEVWCKALASRGEFDPERSSFRAWVFTIARHVLLQAIEAQERVDRARSLDADSTGSSQREAIPDEATSVSQRMARDEGLRRFLAEAERMESDDRVLLILCGLEGKSFGEAAPVLGITRDAAAKRWQRLRAKLAGERHPVDLLLSAPETRE